MNIILTEQLKVDDEEWKKKMNLTKREHIQHKFFKAIDFIGYNFTKEAKGIWGDNRATYVVGLREILKTEISRYIDENISTSAILNPDSIDAKITKPKLRLYASLQENSTEATLKLEVSDADVCHWLCKLKVPVELTTGQVYKVRDVSGFEYILKDPYNVFSDSEMGIFECRMGDTGDLLRVRYASILEGRNHRVIFNPDENTDNDDAD